VKPPRRLHALLGLVLTVSSCAQHATGPDQFVAHGTWGGDHAALTVDATGARIEFDCAHGAVSGPIALDRGQFDVAGVFVREHGGPIRLDQVIVEEPARYSGRVDGRSMTLRVRLTDGLQDVGSYTLALGGTGRVLKCL
jgi:hypothetical protein